MSAPLTPWFPARTKPVRVGLYETDALRSSKGIRRYQHWDGVRWGGFAQDLEAAFNNRVFASEWQHPKWRGLAKKP